MGLVHEPLFPDLNAFITTSREEVSGVMGIFIVVLASCWNAPAILINVYQHATN